MLGSVPGLWIVPLLTFNEVALMATFIIGAGTVSLTIAGYFLDKLALPWSVWFTTWLAISATTFIRWFGNFPTAHRALSKNGSYEAYVLPSVNFGLTAATVIGIGSVLAYRCYLLFQPKPLQQ
jgi:hypothetical protein